MRNHESLFQAGQRLTRQEFENICQDIGLPAPSDAELGEYWDRYGAYWMPQYDRTKPKHIMLAARQARWFAIERENPETPPQPQPRKIPAKEGQLWQPCEQCGREPSYLPLELCDNCWPKEERNR